MQKARGFLRSSLSSRLLLLTICFVMAVEVFVWIPSVAQFRRSFLEQRMTAGEIAALSLLEMPERSISQELETRLLETSGVVAVSLQIEDRSHLILRGEVPNRLDGEYDLSNRNPVTLIGEVFATLRRGGDGVIRVVGDPSNHLGEEIAIILREDALFDAMMAYSRNVLLLSIIISIFTAGLVFLSIHWLLVRPMRRITRSMVEFSKRPEDPERVLVPSDRLDEIGVAERELAQMQEELRSALAQRKRLANLGTAVSKVNHDLRNILATAHLSSDRLLMVDDPKIRELSQRLISSIDRAIGLCERTLKYGRADEPPPKKKDFDLYRLIEDVELSLGLDESESGIVIENRVEEGFLLHADPDHMFRVLLNLGRNAASALEQQHGGRIIFEATSDDGVKCLRISDSGPGMPEQTKENLFVPFKGASGARGTGLGLAIVAELVEANGGRISLETSDETGTIFRIDMPDGPTKAFSDRVGSR